MIEDVWNKDFVKSDEYGNKLEFKNRKLFLDLASESKTRQIGMIEKTGKGTIVYHKRNMKEAVHVMRKNDSWGLHWDIIENLPDEAFILIESDMKSYYIRIADAKRFGEFLWFKTQGFERQFFIPRRYWSTKDE
jgi:hypothetical protein